MKPYSLPALVLALMLVIVGLATLSAGAEESQSASEREGDGANDEEGRGDDSQEGNTENETWPPEEEEEGGSGEENPEGPDPGEENTGTGTNKGKDSATGDQIAIPEGPGAISYYFPIIGMAAVLVLSLAFPILFGRPR